MTDTWQITCINKTHRHDPHERIQAAGGSDGGGWTLTVDQIISLIRQGKRFWVSVGGKSVWVVIAKHNGHDYIKTEPDREQQNNLLSLPECI
jgi:Protein of unknown function (DUF3892)